MSALFPRLFTPARIGSRTLRNRVVFGAHTANMAQDGLPGAQHVAYYAERARGGAAMVVVEPMPVHPAAVLTRGNFRSCDDSVIEPFRAVNAAIQQHGALATGALPDPAHFQKALPALPALPGLDRGGVHIVEDVLSREARPGARVILLDEAAGSIGLTPARHRESAGRSRRNSAV